MLVALATAALFALAVPFGPWPLRVPFSYDGDGLVLAVLLKAVAEDGPLHFARMGAPFGVDFVDWGYGSWLMFLVTTPLVKMLGHAGSALNAYWLLTVVGAGVSSSWAMRRLGVPRWTAFVFSALYALLPGTFYRQVGHIATAYPLVPLLCLLLLRVAGTRPERLDRRERVAVLAACLLQGLAFIYYAFFACVLLVAALPIGWLRARRLALLHLGAWAILLLVLGSAIPLLPSVHYWALHGRNPELAYKTAADSDIYGLKLRHLLLPTNSHPLPILRAVATRASEAHFPGENENTSARLGLTGGAGLLALLLVAVGRTAGARRTPDEDLDGPAAIVLVALLVAQVGGLGSLFNLLVSPAVRAYNRISVFIAFFAFLAAAVLFTRVASRLRVDGGRSRAVFGASLAALLAFGFVDQVPRAEMARVRSTSAPQFAEDEEFVTRLERHLPEDAMVFQLPHVTLPVDLTSRPPMGEYDPGRAYLSSRTIRWSFGSMLGRTDGWFREIERLNPRAMLRRLALAGFDGIWVDRRGYASPGEGHWTVLEARLAELASSTPEVSLCGRYSFVSIEDLRHRLQTELGPTAYAERQAALLGRAARASRP